MMAKRTSIATLRNRATAVYSRKLITLAPPGYVSVWHIRPHIQCTLCNRQCTLAHCSAALPHFRLHTSENA